MDNNNNHNHNQHNHILYIYIYYYTSFMAYQLMNPVYQAHDVTGQTPP